MRVCTPHVRPLTLFLRPPPHYQRRRAVDTHWSPPPCLLRCHHIMDLNITSYLPSLHKIERGVGDFPPPITSVSPSPLPGLLPVIFHSAFALNESISFDRTTAPISGHPPSKASLEPCPQAVFLPVHPHFLPSVLASFADPAVHLRRIHRCGLMLSVTVSLAPIVLARFKSRLSKLVSCLGYRYG